MTDSSRCLIPCLFALAILLPGCKTHKTLSHFDAATGHRIIRQVVIRGNDTIPHGNHVILNTLGDTLELFQYRLNEVVFKKTFDHQSERVVISNLEQGTVRTLKKKQGRVISETLAKEDSILSQTYWDKAGKQYTFGEWHRRLSGIYYQLFLKSFNRHRMISEKYRYRLLLIPVEDRPGMIELTAAGRLKLTFFDYDADKFEYKWVIEVSRKKWRKYNTQLKILEKTPSLECTREIEAFLAMADRIQDVSVDQDTVLKDSYFILSENGSLRIFQHGAVPALLPHITKIRALSGYDREYLSIEQKLKDWKNTLKEDYFLEEVFKIPYNQAVISYHQRGK